MPHLIAKAAALLRVPALCCGLLGSAGGAFAQHASPASLPGIAPSPVVARLVALVEASTDTCSVSSSSNPDHVAVAADVARFRQHVPAASALPIEVLDCYWDGMVVGGRRIVVSTRLARATPAQRFFVIAHEYAHLSAQHHARVADLVSQLLQQDGSPQAVADALQRGAGSPLSRRNETEADALAVQLMLEAGIDPEEAARFLEAAGPPALDTHPGPRSRAAAIRALVAQRVAIEP
jgi:hypothetical protein